MYSTKLIKELSSKTILSIVNELDIFRYYIDNLEIGRCINSPLRRDENPSFMVYAASYGLYRLRFIDYSTSDGGSCFDFVMRMFACDYITSLKIIDRDLKLGIKNASDFSFTERKEIDSFIPKISTERTLIEVKVRSWNIFEDKSYWGALGITCHTLNLFNVYPLSHYRINGVEYKSKQSYGYYFGDGIWKIYSPNSRFKWFSNTNKGIIQGYSQLPSKGDVLVITKSLKDVIVLYELGISSVSPQSETTMLKDDVIEEFKGRFSTIYMNYDFDYAGILYGAKYKRKYGFKNLYFTNGRFGTVDYGAKDLSDYIRLNGVNRVKELISAINK